MEKSKQQQGFTLIEIIIAIFILSIGVIAAYTAFSVMIILTSDSADRLTATYLSQEGIEIVRNIRDDNWINSGSVANGWLTGLADSDTNCSEGCEVDYKTSPINSNDLRPYVAGDYLGIDENGFYAYANVTRYTKFQRKITITTLTVDSVEITSTVFWDEKANVLNLTGAQPSVTTEEILYNWY